MRALVRDVIVPETWTDPDERPLGVQLLVGADTIDGAESFEVLVVTPNWVEVESRKGPFLAKHTLVVNTCDIQAAVEFLRQRVEAVEGADWNELTAVLRQIGMWEFEGYVRRPR